MEFDFKITTWERVTVSKENEEKVLEALKSNKISSADDVYNLLEEDGNIDCNVLFECNELMTLEENGGRSTIEVIDDLGETVFKNGKE